MELSEEAIAEAKLKLHRAIQEYYGTIGDDVFITDWVLIVHKASTSLQKENQSAVGYVIPQDQYFHRTLGLLLAATDSARGIK